MNRSTINTLENFIWNIADEILVDIYDVGDYRKVILPMLVIRRFDAILEPHRDHLLEIKKSLGIIDVNYDKESALIKALKLPFVNQSLFTLRTVRADNRKTLQNNFLAYLDGFSQNVRDIIDKFQFRHQIERLANSDRLLPLIDKFLSADINLCPTPVLNADKSVKLEALDNHAMGTLFENILRRFNESTNVTDAGRHFTPRDIVELMSELAFKPVAERLRDTTYLIYDGACGTGGMLTVAEESIKNLAAVDKRDVSIYLYGQEIADETFAIAKADMLLKGEGEQADNIRHGSTISNDRFKENALGKRFTFDFMLSNPPFGTSWKSEFGAGDWQNFKTKDNIFDARFRFAFDGADFSVLPDIGDQQMLFLANNVAKMKTSTALGSRIVEVHNGSSLFTGGAGSGASNLRRYIIENDYLEAIVALPEKMFYNTGIGTFLWIVANKKSAARRGKVQLIDATSIKSALTKSLGQKNCEFGVAERDKILEIYLAFDKADPTFSRVLANEEFGYKSFNIMRPLRLRVVLDDERIAQLDVKDHNFADALRKFRAEVDNDILLDYDKFIVALKKSIGSVSMSRKKLIRELLTTVDENAAAVSDGKGGFECDRALTDSEQVPLTYEGGIKKFFEREIKPYVPDAWIDERSIVIGYELSFTKYFYRAEELRSSGAVLKEIGDVEREARALLAEIEGGNNGV